MRRSSSALWVMQTFYYDNDKASRNGMGVGPFGYNNKPGWYEQGENIKSVVFDDSFAGYTTITSTYQWFYGCKKLETIAGISNLKTGNVTDMYLMFSRCSALKRIFVDEEKWSITNVTRSGDMFSDCTALVGGNGTVYDANHTDLEYARIDKPGQPGYFTQVGTTGIEQSKAQPVTEGDAWYTLDGRRMAGQPTVGGVYVKDGRKVVVK